MVLVLTYKTWLLVHCYLQSAIPFMTEETMPRTCPRVCVQILDGRVLAVLAPAVSAPLLFCRDKKGAHKVTNTRSDKEMIQELFREKGTHKVTNTRCDKKRICVLKMSSASKQGSFQEIVEAAEKID